MKRFFTVHQLGKSDCGPTALKMLLAYVFQDERYLFIQETWDRPATFKHLLEVAQHFGVTLKGYRLHHPSSIRGMRQPFLALMKSNQSHYVTVIPLGKGQFQLLNPEGESRRVNVGFFQHDFTGYILVVKHLQTVTLPSMPMHALFFPGFYFVTWIVSVGLLALWFWQRIPWPWWLAFTGMVVGLWGMYVYRRMRYLDHWMVHHYLPLIDDPDQFKRFHLWKVGWLRLPLLKLQHILILSSISVYILFASPYFLWVGLSFHAIVRLWLPPMVKHQKAQMQLLITQEASLKFPSIPTRQFHQLYRRVYHHMHVHLVMLVIMALQALGLAMVYHYFFPLQAFLSWATMISLLVWSFHHHLGLQTFSQEVKQWRQVGFIFLNRKDYVKI